MRVPIPCAHGRIVHVRCMLKPAERFAIRYIDSRPFVACRSEWPRRSRHLRPVDLASGRSINEPEGKWAVVRGALQFADPLQLGTPGQEPASYEITDHSQHARDHVPLRRAQSLRPSCTPCLAMILVYL